MKHPARIYAQALASLINKNLVLVLKKNGDLKLLPEIIRLAEKIIIEEEGGREIIIETARPIKDIQQKLKGFFTPYDIIREEINPALLAGVRITINGEHQIDASMKNQIDKLFR